MTTSSAGAAEPIDLELTAQLIEQKLVEEFKFNPELNQGLLKLNGVHNKIPVIIFPITFDKYDDIKNEDIEYLIKQLAEEYNVESYDISSIVEVLYLDNNKQKIIHSIREYNLQRIYKQGQEQQQEKEQQQQPLKQEKKQINKEDAVLKGIYDIWGTQIPRDFTKGKSKKQQKQQEQEQKQQQQEQKEQQQGPPIPFTEWSNNLDEKYSNLQKEILNLIPELWEPVEFVLSIRSILKIENITLPFAGIILGPSSSLKTVTIELFRNTRDTYYTDNFSAKAFVTHNTAIPKEKLHEVDMLPKIKDKLFLTPELSPTFSKKEDDLNEILGIITRVLDGNGYESDTGAQGHRGYSGEYMFTWIGAAVDIPRKVYRLLGTLGPKLYFFRVKTINKDEEYFLNQLENESIEGDFRTKIDRIKIKLHEYLDFFDLNVEEQELPNKRFDSNKKDVHRYIIRLAHLLRKLRGNVPIWDTAGTQGSDYAYTFPTLEDPNRAITQLRNLARGHALSQGRNYISLDDIPLLIKLVLSTASRERVIVFDHLLENKGLLDSTNIADHLQVSKKTALKTMTELIVLGIGNRIALDSNNNYAFQIQLNPEFEWFLSEDFKKLREDFGKEYYSEYLATKQEAQHDKEEENLEEDSKNE